MESLNKNDKIILKGISQKGKSTISTWGNEWIVNCFRYKVGFSDKRNWMFVDTIKRLPNVNWFEGIWINLNKDENFVFEVK